MNDDARPRPAAFVLRGLANASACRKLLDSCLNPPDGHWLSRQQSLTRLLQEATREIDESDLSTEWKALAIALLIQAADAATGSQESLGTKPTAKLANRIRLRIRMLEANRWAALNRRGSHETTDTTRLYAVQSASVDKPLWDAEHGKLWYRGNVAKKLRSRSVATSQCAILDSFQEMGWPERIDDPLPGGKDQERLNKCVEGLNKKLSWIRFRAGGDGKSFTWESVHNKNVTGG